MSKLVENIEKLMRQQGLSQKGLSLKAGLNETAVRDILRGRSKDPQLSTLRALAGVLQCKVEDLYHENLLLPKSSGKTAGLAEKGEGLWPAHLGIAAQEAGVLEDEMVAIEEINMGAVKGIGSLHAAQKNPVLRHWRLPSGFLRQRTTTAFSMLKIISVEGDAMMPEFHPGDRVILDISDTIPSPAGIFMIWDGIGMSLRRCAILPGSTPPMLTLSTGCENYESHEVPFHDSMIGGRAIAKWQWL